MKSRIHWGAAWLGAVLLVAASDQVGRCAPSSDAPAAKHARAEEPVVGRWQAATVSMTMPDGNRRTLSGADSKFNVTISAKNFTMRVRDKLLTDMSYVLDAKQTPCAIDLKSADGVMLGIYEHEGNQLRISLNDEAKGRPRNFDQQQNGMVLLLTPFAVWSLSVVNADGSGLHRVLTMSEYVRTGSPDWSHDGKRIAFDAWKSLYGEGTGDAHVLVVNVDGSGMKDLGPGAMPSWSLDDKQLTFSSYGPERGIFTMNADGTQRACLDAGGWSSEWSPKRNEIVYTVYDNGHADLCIYDLVKKERRTLLDKGYQQIYWSLSWSPDGTWICFKGTLPEGGAEIAAVSAAGEKKGFKVLVPISAIAQFDGVGGGLTWGGSGNQILFSGQPRGDEITRLYVVDFKDGKPFRVFPGLPSDWDADDSAWSRDGKKIAFSASPSLKAAPAKPKARTAATRNQSINNLKQIALGMLNYESAFKHYPLPASLGPNGKPLLSWRVHILPYLEEMGLYKQFHLDEPWDSSHNRTLIERMPAVYRSSMSKHKEKERTNYLLPIGNGAAFRADKPTGLMDIRDGTSNTLMVLEVDDDQAVTWTKPDDWTYDPKKPLKGLGKLYGDAFHTAFCDGSVHVIETQISPTVLRDLIERDDGHAIDASAY